MGGATAMGVTSIGSGFLCRPGWARGRVVVLPPATGLGRAHGGPALAREGVGS